MCMRYINPNSRRGVVNKLADYILSKVDSTNKTRIQVTDFKSFFVINGNTQHDKVLDLNEIKEEFYEKNKDLLLSLDIKQINIIDLIQYQEPIGQLEYYFDVFNSSRPLFHQSVIDEVSTTQLKYDTKHLNSVTYSNRIELEFSHPYDYHDLNKYHYTEFLSVSSEFPYGYSLNMGRCDLYYTEYVCNHLLPYIQYNRIEFKITKQIDGDDDLLISIDTSNPTLDKQLKSLVLDVFDFNLSKFQNDYLSGYDLEFEINTQLSSKPWLVKDRTKDIILF
jgi:hypothetical protein